MADRIGYKRVIVLCCWIFFASKIVFWRADCFGAFLVERVMLAFVIAGISGVYSSFIYLSAGPEKVQRAFGVCGAMETAGVLLSAGVYALFLGDDYRMAAFLTVLSHLVVALLSFGLREVRSEKREDRTGLRQSLDILKSTLKNRSLITLIVAFSLLGEVCHMVTVFLNQLQYTRAGLPASAISVICMVMTLTK